MNPDTSAQTGEVSAAAGAGIFFEERRGVLNSLWLLLQAQARCRVVSCHVAKAWLPMCWQGWLLLLLPQAQPRCRLWQRQLLRVASTA